MQDLYLTTRRKVESGDYIANRVNIDVQSRVVVDPVNIPEVKQRELPIELHNQHAYNIVALLDTIFFPPILPPLSNILEIQF